MALHFEQLSLASLPANLLAAPAIAPVMWLGVLAGVAGQFSRAARTPVHRAHRPAAGLPPAVAHLSAAAPSRRRAPRSPTGDRRRAWVALLGAARSRSRLASRAARRRGRRARGGADWRRRGGSRRRRGSPRPLAVSPRRSSPRPRSRGAEAAPRRPGELVVSFLDVGQGDATLVQLGATAVLVDTGPPEGPILERLKQSGVKRLDALLMTHAEADHEGAAPEVIAEYPPRLIVDGGAGWSSPVQRGADRSSPKVRLATAGRPAIDFGGLRFAILWPKPGDAHEGNPNDHAIVARLTYGAFSLLLTADAESNVTPTDTRARRRAQGRPPRQRRRRPAATARAPETEDRGDRGRPPQPLRTPDEEHARRAHTRVQHDHPHRSGWDGPAARQRTGGSRCSDDGPRADITPRPAYGSTAPVTELSPIRPEQR